MTVQGVWKYLPHFRHVEDAKEDLFSEASETVDVESIPESKEIEYRDEADRPWWKFFDEYEYRVNTKDRENKSWWRWFDKGTSKEEKRLIIKLDILIALYAFIGYWVKYLDQNNISNAYVSGMREDINMKGNDFINTSAIYNVGIVVFQLFFMYIFPRYPLNYVVAGMEIVWGIFTLCIYRVKSTPELQAFRFLVGVGESGYFVFIHFLLGSWYKPDEIARRGGFYYMGQMLGTLTSGLLQANLYTNLSGVGGLAGWRWLFIIDAIVTVPVAILGYMMVPGTPYNCYSLFLTDDEIRLARKRLKDADVQPPSATPPPFFDKKLWKKILTSWKIYVLLVLDYLFWMSGSTAYSGYILWLNSLGRYSVPKVNQLSTIPPALGVLYIGLVCGSADIFRSRTFAIVWAQIFNFTGQVILAIWDVRESAKVFAFQLVFFGISISSVVYGWMNDIMRHDAQERAIVLLITNALSNSFQVWISVLVFPTVEAPEFHRGYVFLAVHAFLLIIFAFVTLWFYKREERNIAKSHGLVLYNSKTGDIPAEAVRYLNKEDSVEVSKEEINILVREKES